MDKNDDLSFTNEVDVKISFGDYLTNQYEILIRTLSFLNINDLSNASLVSRQWYEAVKHIIRKRDENNKLRWLVLSCFSRAKKEATCFLGSSIFHRSSAVLGFESLCHNHKSWEKVLVSKFEGNAVAGGSCDYEVPGVLGSVLSISSENITSPTNNLERLEHTHMQSVAVFFPKIDGFDVQTKFINQDSDLSAVSETLLRYNGNPLKGLLIFDKCLSRPENIEQNLFEALLNSVPSQPFAIAGGIFKNVGKFVKTKWVGNFDVALLAFYGDKIQCYADILQSEEKDGIKHFMMNTRKKLPPFDPNKQQRIAFTIRCIGRNDRLLERAIYREYFPDIPGFIIQSYAEFGYRADSEMYVPEKKTKMDKIEITYSYSSVYFFLTFNFKL